MQNSPVASAPEEYQAIACVVVDQLETREQDPIRILYGEGDTDRAVDFHRIKCALNDRQWSWKAVDDQGREIVSGIVHANEGPAPVLDCEEEETLAGAA